MKPIAVIGYTDVYKKAPPEDLFNLLRLYPTDIIILYLSKINVVLFQEENTQQQAIDVFRHVFIKDEFSHPNYEKIIARILNDEHEILFSAQSISYIIKDSLENYKQSKDNLPIDLKSFQKDLFDTILIYNTSIYEIDVPQLESYHGIWDIAIRQQRYIRDYNALLYTAPIKFMFIQRYFNQSEDGRNILKTFQNRLGLGNFWNFAKTFMDLLHRVLSNKQKGQYILARDEIPEQALLNFSFIKDQQKKISIHLDVMPKPFYELDDHHVAVIDFSYFRYMLDQGIFWLIFHHTLPKGDVICKNFNAFLGKIGHDYFEQFFVGTLLKNLFNKKHQLIVSDAEFEDFWIKLNHKEIFVVEVKMADAHPQTIEAFDVEKFEEFLVKNYAREKGESGGAKGVYQIVRQLDILQKFSKNVQTKFKLKSLKNLIVYPIIIYSDQILDSPGVNSFIQAALAAKLATTGAYYFQVKPVTMIGINTILEHFHFLNEDAKNMANMLISYQKYIRRKQKDYIKFSGPFLYYQQNISFSEYMLKQLGTSKKNTEKNLAIFKKLTENGQF